MSATTTSMASMRGVMRSTVRSVGRPVLAESDMPVTSRPWTSACSGRCGCVEAGAVVDIGSPTQRIVLATLIAHLGQVVPIDVLAEAVWEDTPPASARQHPPIADLAPAPRRRWTPGGLGRRLLVGAGARRHRRRGDVRPRPARQSRRRRRRGARGCARGVAGPRLRRARRHRGCARRGPAPRAGTARRHRAGGRRRPRRRALHGVRGGVRGRGRRGRRARAVVGDPRARPRSRRTAGRGAARCRGERPRPCATQDSSQASTCARPSARRWTRRPTIRNRRPAPLAAPCPRRRSPRRSAGRTTSATSSTPSTRLDSSR